MFFETQCNGGRTADQQTTCNEGTCERTDVGLKCIYVNAGSIINKMDYLRAKVRVLDPDIIGVTESWADKKIVNEEIGLKGGAVSMRQAIRY